MIEALDVLAPVGFAAGAGMLGFALTAQRRADGPWPTPAKPQPPRPPEATGGADAPQKKIIRVQRDDKRPGERAAGGRSD